MASSGLKASLIKELTKPTERDKQSLAGPSDLGNPCPKCLGRKMAGGRQDNNFSLFPWIGTAGHAYLEEKVFQTPDYLHEQKLYVGDVPGYGPIKGTADLIKVSDPTMVVDWKFVGIKKIASYRVNGAPKRYRYQIQLYARGCEIAGFPVESVAIVFIPRDSGSVSDIFVHEEIYQPDMAEAALARAGEIYAIVQEKGWETLPSDKDCWDCNYNW
jgi:hypothetical protein